MSNLLVFFLTLLSNAAVADAVAAINCVSKQSMCQPEMPEALKEYKRIKI